MNTKLARRVIPDALLINLLLVIIYLAYISLGLPDSLLGIAWPYIRVDFNRLLSEVGILTISGTICSALSSLMSGHVVGRFGTGRVTFVSCLMTATGLIGYSLAPSFWWLLPCIPLLGFGAGSIDCGLNFYVAAHYPSRHMNWLHCCWGIGATVGPMIMTFMITGGLGWRSGYRTIGLIQLGLSVILFLALGLWLRVQEIHAAQVAGGDASSGDASSGPGDGPCQDATCRERDRKAAMRAQIAIYVVYVSCEFLIGLWAFSLLTVNRGVNPASAGLWVSVYYGSLTVARFLTGFVVDRLGNRFMIRLGLILSLAGCVILGLPFFVPGLAGMVELAALACIGAGFGPIYPCMTHETARRFSTDTARRMMGYQIGAACIGSAAFPALVGWFGQVTTLEILSLVVFLLVAGTLSLTARLDSLTANGPV